jgi:ribosomal protein L7/L12
MVETFNCPACGGPLRYAHETELTILCPHCHNTVIVPEELRGGLKVEGTATTSEQPTSIASALPSIDPQQVEKDIRELLAERQKIMAIKIYRQVTGAGLKQAKDAVEAIEAGGTLDASQLGPLANLVPTPVDDASAFSQATQLLKKGDKITAIRLLRNHFDVSLMVAKDAADRLEKGQQVDIEWLKIRAGKVASASVKLPPAQHSKGVNSIILWGCLLGVLLVLIIILLTAVVR